ncbi:MAG: formate dehydrogenase accessory sulfurtransferase FdhD [Smithella sp.]|jgi:FdhD protein|nr:formate dehydrogenase accessory sulfurtransferase FdhD [Smithella sp.]
MSLPTYENITVHEYRDKVLTEVTMPFSAEYAVLLKINGLVYLTMACSGNHLSEHVTGYLISEGIISNTSQIESTDIDEAGLTVNVTLVKDAAIAQRLERIKTVSAAGGRTKRTLPSEELARSALPCVRAQSVIEAMNEFLVFSQEHKATHGVHGAALYSLEGERLAFFDEIGRHNAIDKVIGHAAVSGISLEDKMICSTGRVSSEIALKLIHARAPVLVTRASPTTLSVELLRRYNLLSIVRAVGGRFYVVNGKENILLPAKGDVQNG